MELSGLPGGIRNWILFLFCYPFGPDPVSPLRGVGVSGDGVGGVSGTVGFDLCQVAVTGAPQRAHIRPHLSPQRQAVRLGSSCCRLGVWVSRPAEVFSTPRRLIYLRRMQHLAGPPPSWTITLLTDINRSCGVSSQSNRGWRHHGGTRCVEILCSVASWVKEIIDSATLLQEVLLGSDMSPLCPSYRWPK